MQKVLIVGAGLSGICLAHHFLQRGLSVVLFDNGVNHSSTVAAGMINPLVFRRMTKSWRVDEFLPYAQNYYTTLENQWGTKVYHPIVIRRFFSSEQERNFWIERQDNPAFKEYMFPITEADEQMHPYANPFGSGRVNKSAFIDAELFLETAIGQLKTQLDYRKRSFIYAELNPEMGEYDGEKFDYCIFAEGYLGVNNPWFQTLALTQTKGETLTIQLDQLQTDESLNRKCFLLPLGPNTFKIGSNYSWDDPTTHITEEAKNEILDHLNYLTPEIPFVISQNAGVRPTTKDRRPFIGKHPEFPKLCIFNGLGAKGYLIAPLLVNEFVSYLLDGTPLDKECEINHRFNKKNS